ncbi:S-layer homology domain-containing protein [Alkalihalophilus pseudofirmus]|jgi:hypothetical protein|uniref:S-layer homology domain-containing protein n=1 Tax=Alkalihalophilus pseudofirmus TaxID=79885 RepID=A0AAJ2NPQ9_ALKPS|nr:S-layer homology domain-containing protein [Alkalihalophilus pseudofirmus]MDV2886325.1 S-layer homology domain-containing protein [Alkalihalophilus pseudofirmus]
MSIKAIKLIVAVLVFLSVPSFVSAAENGSVAERKALLTDLAIKHNVPPEIVKAIAYQETGMRQFDADGNVIRNMNDDGGIGMMQVTMSDQELLDKEIDRHKLENDMAYNIEVGIEILVEKLRYQGIRTPYINQGKDLSKLESWYFAILAYNGLEIRNDPAQGVKTYQDKVYDIINNRSTLATNQPSSFPVTYREGGNIMYFNEDQMNVELHERLMTSTTQMFNEGDYVYTFVPSRGTVNLRDEPHTGSSAVAVPHITPLKVLSGPYHDNSLSNHFVFYKVERLDNGQKGYMASAYLRKGNPTLFPDLGSVDAELKEAVSQLELRGSINGYPDGNYGPNEPLQRIHAATILVNELGLTLPAGYVPRATDHGGSRNLIIAEAHGLLTPYSDGQIKPREPFRRAQMAGVLTRAFSDRFEQPTTNAVFTDIDTSFYNYDQINTLAYNGITVVNGKAFQPNAAVTRGQFALFLNRTDELLKK